MYSRIIVPVAITLSIAVTADAGVFHARAEAMELAFPGLARVETETVFITRGQREAIEQRARCRLGTRPRALCSTASQRN